MKIKRNSSNFFRMTFSALAIALAFGATSCTEQDTLVEEPVRPAVEAVEVAEDGEANAASLTVSGTFIEYRDGNLCSECTYVIPEDATVVDGAELDIKPGDVICLNAAFKYKGIELNNVQGAEGKPVIIANCGE
jgi:hypothetical protein